MVQDLIDIPQNMLPGFPQGMVWLVGAGPGDPGLMTLHGLNAIRQADVIVHDALVDERILEWCRPTCELVYAGKKGGKPSAKQEDISLRLIAHARSGKRVVRLKGGDPFIFGRGGEEAQVLTAAGVPVRVTPGITAGVGGLAYAGIPATHRDVNQSITFLTGHDRQGLAPSAIDWAAMAKSAQVIVMYMAMKHLGTISAQLIEGGRDKDEPVAVVARATLPDMRVLETTLGEAAAEVEREEMEPPAIICVGRVVLMRQAIDWLAQAAGAEVRDYDPLGTGLPEFQPG